MKERILFLSLLIVLYTEIFPQPFDIQAGIFNSGATLIVKAIPGSTINNKVFSAVNFTIRWRNDYGVSLGAITTDYAIFKNGNENTHISNSINYRYQIFSGIPNVNVSWNSGEEITLLSIPVNQTGFGSGTFELAPNDFLPSSGEEWYIEIGGVNRTNSIFNPSSTPEVPLPLELISIQAFSANNNAIKLVWQTKTESNSNRFDVERKIISAKTHSNWKKIGTVSAAGNSSSPKNYFFVDSETFGGSKFCYRLKMIDNDGTFKYSDEVEFDNTPNQYILYQNYPNPFNPTTKVNFAIPVSSHITLSIYNLLGEKIIDLVDDFLESGTYSLSFDGHNLASGFYIYRLEAGEQVFTKKMQLLK